MQDQVQLPAHVYVVGYIVIDKSEILIAHQMGYIICIAGDQVIHTDHLVPFR